MVKFFQSNLSGGMNTRTSVFTVKPNELKLGRNVTLEQLGSIRKRSGYGGGITIQANKEILGLYEFVITSTGAKYLLAISNNSGDTAAVMKYSSDFLTFTTHPDSDLSALQENAKYEFANFIDLCFVAGYSADDSTFQQVFTISGILNGDYDASSFVTGAPNAKYIIQSNDRIFLVNTSNSSNEYFWSDLPAGSPGAWTLTWTSTNSNRVETNDGEELAGVGKNFNRVLLFKNSSIHKWDADNEQLIRESGSIGSTSHRSIKNLGGSTVFYRNGFGFYEYAGQEPFLISRKIDDWIGAISNVADVASFTDGTIYQASVGNITIDGRTYNNVAIEYNTVLESWVIKDNFGASVIATYGETDRKSFYMGSSSSGKVYEMFSHTTTSTSSTSSSTSSTSSSTSSTSSTSVSTSSTSSTSTTP